MRTAKSIIELPKNGQHLVAPRNEIGNVVKGKLVMLFRRFVLFARNVGRNRENDNKGKLRPKYEWPYVMRSFVAIRGPLVSRTWICHHQHVPPPHGDYRNHRQKRPDKLVSYGQRDQNANLPY